MDFDEYEYLEKTVENAEIVAKDGAAANGSVEKGKERRSSRHRSDAEHDDLERGSKRARSREVSRDDRERGASRQRPSPDRRSRNKDRSERDRERDRSEKDRHRNSREHRDRKERERTRDRDIERDGEKERERERSRRSSEKVRDPDQDIECDREKERERERSRRSRSRSEKHISDREKDVERDRDREKSRDRERREREKERELIRERDREGRRYKDKKEEAEPEADPERDQRTVFAYQICLKADERDVYEFFSKAGKVRDVRLITDRNSRRSKGVGYIEFYDAMSVPMAIALSGQLLRGIPVMVKPSEAEKNLVQSSTAVVGPGGGTGPYSGGARRLYVGNLHFNITEEQLRQVFEPFGAVELVQLPLDQETGHCKGFGFVQFARLEDARAAQSLNGQLDIAGRVIKVSAISDQVGMTDMGVNAGDFDDDDGGGLSLNARSRAMLMMKLDRSGEALSNISGSVSTPIVNGTGLTLPTVPIPGFPSLGPSLIPSLAGMAGTGLSIPAVTNPVVDDIGTPSECLLLKNMFDPNTETEPDFDLDIKEDVQDECTKYGKLNHIYVDKNSMGHVYLRFADIQSASNAQRSLHGRWFAGKMITATYMLPFNYETKFPDSTSGMM